MHRDSLVDKALIEADIRSWHEALDALAGWRAEQMQDAPSLSAAASETGRGMDAAFYAAHALVKRHPAAFSELELVMVNYRLSHLSIGGLRVERGNAEQE